jgi:uncharacterized glyoxalase superfamily protein PhnB
VTAGVDMNREINTTQVVTPYLSYEDVGEAIDWLVRVLGFRERMRLALPGGSWRMQKWAWATAPS